MTVAPRPGTTERLEAKEVAAAVMTLTIKGESLKIAPNNLPFSERLALRKATGGMSLESFWGGETAIGIDSIQVLWWLARRANGVTPAEKNLSLDDALEQFPSDLTPDDINVEVDTPDEVADDPEASGPDSSS